MESFVHDHLTPLLVHNVANKRVISSQATVDDRVVDHSWEFVEITASICHTRIIYLVFVIYKFQVVHFIDVLFKSFVFTVFFNIQDQLFLLSQVVVKIVCVCALLEVFRLIVGGFIVEYGFGHRLEENPMVSSPACLELSVLEPLELFIQTL